MNIVVCIKFVRTDLVNENQETEDRFVLNPYDLFTLECAVSWKNQMDCNVICLTMGPKGIQPYLQRLYGMGADRVICLSDSVFAGSDTVATSYILSSFIRECLNYDLILCGEMAVDGETGQVPAGLAARLNVRYVSGVKAVREFRKDSIVLEAGNSEFDTELLVAIPAVLSVNEFTMKAKSIGLMALKKAQQKEIEIITSGDFNVDVSKCGLRGSKTKVLEVEANFIKKDSQRLYGEGKREAELIKKLVMKNHGEMCANE
ncbi:MAG: hypothetical protein LBT06_20530 [Hungatella sp.]|nr:hypothetical protein [Hungatella sp.]